MINHQQKQNLQEFEPWQAKLNLALANEEIFLPSSAKKIIKEAKIIKQRTEMLNNTFIEREGQRVGSQISHNVKNIIYIITRTYT